MKANAFTVGNVTVYRVWATPPFDPVSFVLPANSPVFVLFSPRHARWILSFTTHDYRYDSFVELEHFRLDPTLLPVDIAEEPAERYYLNRIKFLPKRVA